MGAGKSAVGRELAAALGCPFVDTDELIAAQAGPIDDDLRGARRGGVPRARGARSSTAAVADALERPCVLALGGGAVLSAAVREALGALAARRLAHRAARGAVGGARGRRGRRCGRSPLDEAAFRALLATREPLYRRGRDAWWSTPPRSPPRRSRPRSRRRLHAAPPEAAARRRARRRRPVKRLTVHAASRTYPILVGRGVLDELGAPVRRLRGEGQVVVVCDENVAPLYLDRVRASLTAAGLSTSQVILPAGEREKSLARAEELYGVLYDRGLRRSDTLVALGGGVIGDLTGFVAATYQRGIGLRPGADDAAGAGGRLRRRQGRRGLPRRQELRRHLLPAEPRPGRSGHAATRCLRASCAAAPPRWPSTACLRGARCCAACGSSRGGRSRRRP